MLNKCLNDYRIKGKAARGNNPGKGEDRKNAYIIKILEAARINE